LQLIKYLAQQLAQSPPQPDFTSDSLHRSIAEYAAEVAGSEFDFDDELEAAAVEHLMNDEAERTAYHSCKRDA
jgi:hypothetical protein